MNPNYYHHQHQHQQWRPNFAVPSPEMEESVSAVEMRIKYGFRDRRLLEEALTHSSSDGDKPTYQILEFLGDTVLQTAVSTQLIVDYPGVEPGQLSALRAAIISTESLARVAVRHHFYPFLRRNAPPLDDKVRKFTEIVRREDNTVAHGGSLKAPKVLADIVESIAAAIFTDLNYNLDSFWKVFKHLLEPMAKLDDVLKQPQPITTLYELCQKNGKKLDFRHWKDGAKNVISVHVEGTLVASGSSEQKETAKLIAAKKALVKLHASAVPPTNGMDKILLGIDCSTEIEAAKQKLLDICAIKKWPKPTYKVEKEEGRAHEKLYTSSVQIPTAHGILFIMGDEKSRIRVAENSAASSMIHALRASHYL